MSYSETILKYLYSKNIYLFLQMTFAKLDLLKLYIIMLKKKMPILVIILLIGHVSAQNSSKCNYTINSWYWKFDGSDVGNLRNVTIHDPIIATKHPINNIGNNPKLSLKGGDVVCMDASVPYRFLTWENISGDPENPIIIKNTNGQVKIKSLIASYGWVFKKSKHFKILGNGDPNHKYGFKITTHNNSYIKMIDKTTDFEIAHVEVAGDYANGTHSKSGFAGIMAKSQPICVDDPNGGSTDANNFELKNVSIHDNYIHDVGGEGMYVGYGKSQGVLLNSSSTGNKCSTINYPHNVSNLYIFNNIIENVGWDGIQVKNAHHNAQIYNNVIKNYATLGIGAHDEGLFVGDGSEALIYGNWIEKGNVQSNGMQINAFGNTKIYNNVVLGAGYNGLYLNNQSTQFANRTGTFEIYNNTIEGGTGSAIVTYTPQNVLIKNNIGFGYDAYHGIKKPVNGITSSNLVKKDVSKIGFINYNIGDIRLNTGSLAIDAGESNSLNTNDFTGSLRTDGNIDIGAIEKGLSVDNSDLNLSIVNPSSNIITITTGETVPVKASLTDANNKVKSIKYILNSNVINTNFVPNKVEYSIPYQSFVSGDNTFYIEATLYSGLTFFSAPITINTPNVLNVNKNQLSSQLKIHYNNRNKELIINKLNDINIKNIEIYNLLSKKVQSFKNRNQENKMIRININNLPSAIYIIKVVADKGFLTKKIILTSNVY